MHKLKISFVALVCVLVGALLFIASPVTEGADAEQVYSGDSVTTTTEAGPTQEEIDRWNEAVWISKTNERIWNETVWINKTNETIWITKTNERLAAEAAAEKARQAAAARSQSSPSRAANTPSSGRCGGNLPPCCVMMRESGGSLTAQNPTSSASGKWQFINGTWNGYGGYAEAWMAPESVQDAKAAELWAGGAGASHWGGGC